MAQSQIVQKQAAKKAAAKTPSKASSSKKSGPKARAQKSDSKPIESAKRPLKKASTKKAVAKTATSPKSAAKKPNATQRATPPDAQLKASGAEHPHTQALLELRAFGLSYPETHLKSPWPDHLDLAVRDKTFAYLSIEGEPLHLSCKLPESCQAALDLEFTEPTGYGLGKSGWVTATFKDGDEPPVEFLKTWLDESYRAQAPKSLSKKLPKMTSD